MSVNDPATETGFPPTPSHFGMPTWYPALLDSVTAKITTGRQRATAKVNAELILTYWSIGRDILYRQEQEGCGTKVIDRLSADLRERFPDAKGYSPRNLKYMRKFAEAWPDPEVVQRSVAQLPWRHQIALLEKLDRPDQRLWYAVQAIEEGWSRDILALKIDTRLHERVGKAITNFAATMPPEDSDMAQQATKDPYIFDFLDITERSRERELETGLVEHIGKFLLELGQGFAFVGQQVRLTLDDEEFYCDCSDSRIIPIDAGRALWRRDSASVVGITARDCWLASDEWPTSRSSRCDRCVALSRSVGDLTWEGRDDGASDVRVGGWGAGGIPQRRAERCIAQVSQELLRDRAQVLRCAQHRGVRRADSGHVPG